MHVNKRLKLVPDPYYWSGAHEASTAGIGTWRGWKQDFGARTVLVLEENDIQLTNVHLVTDALLKGEEGRTDIADEVYLVTSTITPWWLHVVRVDTRTYFELTNPDERGWEMDPTSLVNLTESG